MASKKSWVIHPYLVGLFPVLFLYAHNISYIPVEQLLQPSILLLVSSAILLGVARGLLGNWGKAGILTSCFWLFFFTFQYFHLQLVNWLGEAHAKQSILLIAGSSLQLVLYYFLRKKESSFNRINKVLNFFSALLVLMPLGEIIPFQVNKARAEAAAEKQERLIWQPKTTPAERPDIVYLILDGVGRPDLLANGYGVDLSRLELFLKKEGFFSAVKSNANYSRTAVSLASSLNADYIQNLPGYHPKLTYNELDQTVEQANVLRWLKMEGYSLVSFSTSYPNAELSELATLITPFPSTPALTTLLFNLTPLQLLETNSFLYSKYAWFKVNILGQRGLMLTAGRQHYEKVLYSLDHIPDYVGQEQPSLIFADLFVGHPPFVFTKDGSYQAPPANLTDLIADGNDFTDHHPGGRKAYITGYRDQVQYLSQKIIDLVLRIKKSMTRPTIIILQGDHGPGAHYVQEDYTKTNLPERFGILNAIYISDKEKPHLPDDLSPVNTFRYLLNHYYQVGYPILPNRFFFSPPDHPADVKEVTHLLQGKQRF